MKVVLINTPYLYVYGPINVGRNFTFPLGLGYIAAVLRDAGHDVTLLDPEPMGMNLTDIGKKITKESPEVVGITCATPNFGMACRIAHIAKQTTNVVTVLGGVHASAVPKMILNNHPEFDVIGVGEGEYTMLELCNNAINLPAVNGIVFRKGDSLCETSPRPFAADVDKFPFPARDLVDLNKYRLQVHLDRGKRSTTMITSRGCPYRCTFCASHLTTGHRLRVHSAEYVIAEIKHLVIDYGIELICFMDDTFTVDQERVKRICNLILERNIKIDWFCFARVDTVSRELLELMKKAGCYALLYGIESANKEVLKDLKKGITPDQARRALKISNELGLKTEASFILGNPKDTREAIEETINFAIELKPVIGSFNRLVPYPGTEIFKKYYKSKLETTSNNEWDNFVPKGVNVVVGSQSLSRQELQKYTVKAYSRFYLRPSQIVHMLRHIDSFAEFKIYLRGGFGLLRQALYWSKKSRTM